MLSPSCSELGIGRDTSKGPPEGGCGCREPVGGMCIWSEIEFGLGVDDLFAPAESCALPSYSCGSGIPGGTNPKLMKLNSF